jgi:hypothetical protein
MTPASFVHHRTYHVLAGNEWISAYTDYSGDHAHLYTRFGWFKINFVEKTIKALTPFQSVLPNLPFDGWCEGTAPVIDKESRYKKSEDDLPLFLR